MHLGAAFSISGIARPRKVSKVKSGFLSAPAGTAAAQGGERNPKKAVGIFTARPSEVHIHKRAAEERYKADTSKETNMENIRAGPLACKTCYIYPGI